MRGYAKTIGLVVLGIAVSGTNACQEDYEFGEQSTVSSQTPTPTATASTSPSSSPTATPSPDETDTEDTPTPTATATPTATPATSALLRAISDLSQDPSETPSKAPGGASSGAHRSKSASNWLGKIYDDEEIPGASLDSDGDGYSDKLEQDFSSDSLDAKSFPNEAPRTSLADRLGSVDRDLDGLSDLAERRLGTDPNNPDSDGDGARDGAEVLSGGIPKDANSHLFDIDGDGLSDHYEATHGLNGGAADTDGDGLNDDMELAIGSNPLENDSDKDGILDGKEFSLGSDPTIAEPNF